VSLHRHLWITDEDGCVHDCICGVPWQPATKQVLCDCGCHTTKLDDWPKADDPNEEHLRAHPQFGAKS
jgi:hypothetical protein